jgi:hypothetical protein
MSPLRKRKKVMVSLKTAKNKRAKRDLLIRALLKLIRKQLLKAVKRKQIKTKRKKRNQRKRIRPRKRKNLRVKPKESSPSQRRKKLKRLYNKLRVLILMIYWDWEIHKHHNNNNNRQLAHRICCIISISVLEVQVFQPNRISSMQVPVADFSSRMFSVVNSKRKKMMEIVGQIWEPLVDHLILSSLH